MVKILEDYETLKRNPENFKEVCQYIPQPVEGELTRHISGPRGSDVYFFFKQFPCTGLCGINRSLNVEE